MKSYVVYLYSFHSGPVGGMGKQQEWIPNANPKMVMANFFIFGRKKLWSAQASAQSATGSPLGSYLTSLSHKASSPSSPSEEMIVVN